MMKMRRRSWSKTRSGKGTNRTWMTQFVHWPTHSASNPATPLGWRNIPHTQSQPEPICPTELDSKYSARGTQIQIMHVSVVNSESPNSSCRIWWICTTRERSVTHQPCPTWTDPVSSLRQLSWSSSNCAWAFTPTTPLMKSGKASSTTITSAESHRSPLWRSCTN